MNLVKPPFSYAGNKYRVLKKGLQEKLVSGLAEDGKLFDTAFGAGSVIINSPNGGEASEYNEWLVFAFWYLNSGNRVKSEIPDLYEKFFGESGVTKESYLALRTEFNSLVLARRSKKVRFTPSRYEIGLFIILMQLSFNSLLRFNKKGEYNVPIGRKKYQSVDDVVDRLQKIDITFRQESLLDFKPHRMKSINDVAYFDPPYYLTPHHYGGWSIDEEQRMYSLLDRINGQNRKFVLSNVWTYRNISNSMLRKWAMGNSYNVQRIDLNYLSYVPIDGVERESMENTIEVLISNY